MERKSSIPASYKGKGRVRKNKRTRTCLGTRQRSSKAARSRSVQNLLEKPGQPADTVDGDRPQGGDTGDTMQNRKQRAMGRGA